MRAAPSRKSSRSAKKTNGRKEAQKDTRKEVLFCAFFRLFVANSSVVWVWLRPLPLCVVRFRNRSIRLTTRVRDGPRMGRTRGYRRYRGEVAGIERDDNHVQARHALDQGSCGNTVRPCQLSPSRPRPTRCTGSAQPPRQNASAYPNTCAAQHCRPPRSHQNCG